MHVLHAPLAQTWADEPAVLRPAEAYSAHAVVGGARAGGLILPAAAPFLGHGIRERLVRRPRVITSIVVGCP